MKQNSLRQIIFSSLVFVLFALPMQSQAAVGPVRVKNSVNFRANSITARAAIVVDTKTGKVLFEKNADTPRVGASLTKLMTSLVYTSQNPELNQQVALTSEDEVGGGRLRVDVGTKLTAKDLIYCAIVGSANNTATAMMRVSGLPEQRFLQMMNEKAIALGMTKTQYVDASGMNPNNITTARDVSRLAIAAFETPIIQKAGQTADYHFFTIEPVIDKHVKNTNGLLLDQKNNIWVLAGKTGYLEEAGYNLATRVQTMQKTKDITVVVLGADTKNKSFSEAEQLAKWAWKNYAWQR